MLAAHGILLAAAQQFATLNPQDVGAPAGITLSAGNLRASPGPAPIFDRYYLARATMGVLPGQKVYWEVICNRVGPGGGNYSYGSVVVCPLSYAMERSSSDYPGVSGPVVGGPYFGDGTYFNSVMRKSLPTITGNVVVRNLLDMGAGTLSQAFDSGAFSIVAEGLSGVMYPAIMTRHGSAATARGFAQANFGSTPFAYAVPAGARPGVFA